MKLSSLQFGVSCSVPAAVSLLLPQVVLARLLSGVGGGQFLVGIAVAGVEQGRSVGSEWG